MINTQSFKLDIKQTTSPRLRVVNGDTANRFIITVTDNDNAVALSETLNKVVAVFTRADGQIYTQDASTGLSFTASGVVTIDVSSTSFRSGTNKIFLQIYTRESTDTDTYNLLASTHETQFYASTSPLSVNSNGEPLPMLEAYRLLAKSWAVGGTGRRDGEDTDNSKFYSEMAQEAVEQQVVAPSITAWLNTNRDHFDSELSDDVGEWLDENITPTTPAIDASLSVSGAGADAKVTGDIVAAKKITLADGYIKTVAEEASVDLSVLTDTTTVCAVVNCNVGDIFHIYGTPINVSTKRPIMFVTSENVCYFRSVQNEKFSEEVVAPITGKLVINLSKSADYAVYRNKVELSHWTQAVLNGLVGIVPKNYIRRLATGTTESKAYTVEKALSGTTTSNYSTDKYTVTGGEMLIATGIIPSQLQYSLALFYDADGNFLGYHDRVDGQTDYVCEPIVCPPKCAYVRFTHHNSNTMHVYRIYTDVSKRKRVTREGDLIYVSDGTYTLGMSKHGNNNLMDLKYIIKGDTVIYSAGTDWQGPYVVAAKNNANGDAIAQGQTYTGGNHAYAYDGGSGSATARTLSFKVVADGIELEDGGDLEWHDYVEISWVNRVQAWNTKKSDGTGREVLEERPVWTFRPHGIVDVQNTITALEDITVSGYYGMQMAASWMSKGLFIPTATRDIDSVSNIYNGFGPEFDGSVVKGYDINLDITMELDTTFDLGTGVCIGDLKQTHINTSKAYMRTVYNTDFDEDNVFAYRGRYTFRCPS